MKTVKYVGLCSGVEFQDHDGRWYEVKRGETVDVPDELVTGRPPKGEPYDKDGNTNNDFDPGRPGLLVGGDFEVVEAPKAEPKSAKREENR